MKMLLPIILIVAGCLAVSFSRAGQDVWAQEIFRIKAAATGEVLWTLHRDYRHTQLRYNNTSMEAYYTGTENLLGFGKDLCVTDLPQPVIKKICRRFSHSTINSVMLFIDAQGSIFYYAGVLHNNTLRAVKISSRCRLSVLQKIALN